jgi:glycerophosphoryl diester phosphodiesterase
MIPVFGHRGSGCTDSPHAQARRDGVSRPAENTLPSIMQAFDDGANGVEIDAVQTRDGEIVVVHSDLLSDHVFYDCGAAKISELALAEVRALDVAPGRSGKIPTLAAVLAALRETHAFKNGSAPVINIEIKGKKGTGGQKNDIHVVKFHDALVTAIEDFPLKRIIFSSFATFDLIEMRKRKRDALLAQLFDVPYKEERDVYPEQNIPDARYLHFTRDNIIYAINTVGIQYAHPAIDSLTDDNMAFARECNIGVNCWALGEAAPDADGGLGAQALALAEKHGTRLGIITDYVAAYKKLITA